MVWRLSSERTLFRVSSSCQSVRSWPSAPFRVTATAFRSPSGAR